MTIGRFQPMRAIRVHAYGGPEVLTIDDIPLPEPGAGQIRLKVEATGVNFIEIYQRTGAYSGTLPFTPGAEAAGTVDAVGDGVNDLHIGDRVATVNALGSYAEFALVPAERTIPIPDGVDTHTAAAAMLQGMTAHYLTYSTFPLKAGDTAIVHAAAGGVGLLITQIATQIGARVLATTSTPEKAELARQAGAEAVLSYDSFEREARQLTNGRGVDVVYDSVGKTTFDRSLKSLRLRGMLVLFGQSSGAVEPINPQVLNSDGSLYLTRPTLAHYIAEHAELLDRAETILGKIADRSLNVQIGATFSLAQAGEAQAALASRATTGKVILVP